jgi:hypothetical protein
MRDEKNGSALCTDVSAVRLAPFDGVDEIFARCNLPPAARTRKRWSDIQPHAIPEDAAGMYGYQPVYVVRCNARAVPISTVDLNHAFAVANRSAADRADGRALSGRLIHADFPSLARAYTRGYSLTLFEAQR